MVLTQVKREVFQSRWTSEDWIPTVLLGSYISIGRRTEGPLAGRFEHAIGQRRGPVQAYKLLKIDGSKTVWHY